MTYDVDDQPSRGARSWKSRPAKVTFAVLGFLLAAGSIVDPIRNWGLWRITHGLSEPTCQDPAWLERASISNAKANSYKGADDGVNYFPGNSVDGDMATAWVALKHSKDERLSISWQLPKPETVRLICFTPGYAKAEDRFKNNQRLKRVTLRLNSETQSVVVGPVDQADYQALVPVQVRCVDCKEIEMVITDTYGAPGGDPEVAISEVIVYQDTRMWPIRLLPW